MSFIVQVTISIVIYFFIRIFSKSERSLYVSVCFSAFAYILIFLSINGLSNTNLNDAHKMVTGLSLFFLFVAYNEIIILERRVRKIKKGQIINNETFPIEKGYKIVFKILGIGLTLLSLVAVSGLSMEFVYSTELIFKAIFTFIAWLIYLVTLIGIKFFNFSTRYATRGLFIAMWAVLAAYYMNSYLVNL